MILHHKRTMIVGIEGRMNLVVKLALTSRGFKHHRNVINLFSILILILIIIAILALLTNGNPLEENSSPTNLANNRNSSRTRKSSTKESCLPSNGCLRVTRNDTVFVETKLPEQINQTQQSFKTTTLKPTNANSKKIKLDLNKLFREDVEDYPEENITLALKKTSDLVKTYFNVLNTLQDPHANLTERVATNEYDNIDSSHEAREEPICRSVLKTIVPRDAWLNERRVFIPNDREFMQVITAEICANVGAECSHLEGVMPEGVTSHCVQKYAYKRLLYMDSAHEKLASDSFKYPSCCSCHIKFMQFDMRSLNSGPNSKPTPKSTHTLDVNLSRSPIDNNNKTNISNSDGNTIILEIQ